MPWLDPTAILTDEEERELDAIFAALPREVVARANAVTARQSQSQSQSQEQSPHGTG